jgi:predicted MFS family arabinose efflux permease
VYLLSTAVALDLGSDAFVLFTVLWIAGPQGWTGAQTALIVIALRLPALVGGWIGGRAIDRYGPVPLMIAQAVVRIGCLVGLTGFAWSGHYPLLGVLVLGGLSGAVVPIGYAAARTLVPRLLPESQFARANTLLVIGDQASLLVGAALVGPLLSAIGAGPALLAPVVMLCGATALYVKLPREKAAHIDTTASLPGASSSPLSTTRSWRRPVYALVTLSCFYYFVYGPFEPALPYFTRQNLHAGVGSYSVLWFAFGLGALVGLTQTSRLSRYRPGLVNAVGAALWGLVTIPLVFTTSTIVAAVVMVVSGAVWGPYLAIEATALQRWTPPAIHGRLFGIQHAILAVATPLGAAAGSLALLDYSSKSILTVALLACLGAGLLALTSRSIRQAR